MNDRIDFLRARYDELAAALDSGASSLPDTPFVRAEIASKRAVLDLHEPYDSEKHGGLACWTCGPGGFPYPCATLRALAQPYAGHPGFRNEWDASAIVDQ